MNRNNKNIAFFERPVEWDEDVYCYAYSYNDPSNFNAPWPGMKMLRSFDKRTYHLMITIPNPIVIFTDGCNHFPATQAQNGYKLEGRMILHSGKWERYERKQKDSRIEKFNIKTKITVIPDTPVSVKHIPHERDVLSSINNGDIRLVKCLGGGGEGYVFKTNTPYIAKIYKQGKLTQRNKKKLELMISHKISCKGICYPVDLLYSKQEFVGFLMPEAKGDVLHISVFQPMVMKELHPGWKKLDLVDLSLTILEKIKYLHDRNIILGDINPQNILVVDPKEVYFVDTDSYQIEDFPCPVGTVYFTAPELQGKAFKEYLRTVGNENFAIATLLFMLMLPGKPPYAHVGGGSPMENIKAMYFPYPFGEFTENTPPGFWRFCWSHLPFKMKEAFYQTFMKAGTHACEANRLSVDEWIKLFQEYKYLLQTGKMEEQDEIANDIFPTRLKRKLHCTYVKCAMCGNEFASHKLKQGLCYECLQKNFEGKKYQCEKCNGEVLFTNYNYYVEGKRTPFKYCKKCFNWGNQLYQKIACRDCGQQFEIKNYEHEYFMQRQWKDPIRCKRCLSKRK